MIYTPADFPILEKMQSVEMVCNKKGLRKKKHYREIFNITNAFDIESSTIRLPDGPHSFMYVWQFAAGADVCVGRTWQDFFRLMETLRDYAQEVKDARGYDELPLFVVYVHNLAYEFQFLSGLYDFKPEDVFLRGPRKPIYARMYECIEFRCSYLLSNMALEKFLQQMKAEHQKQSGQEFDYKKIRYSWTALDEKEMRYAVNDVLGLVEAVNEQMSRDGDTLRTIPLTSTGYVRRDCKRAVSVIRDYIGTLLPNEEQYKMLRAAFRGGNTHANCHYTGKILDDVYSNDMVSCYPAQQLTRDFPSTPYKWLDNPTPERIMSFIRKNYSVVFEAYFEGLELIDEREPIPYLSYSKTVSKGAELTGEETEDEADGKRVLLDNGRILRAQISKMTITELDFLIILRQYDFKKLAIGKAMIAKKAPLPWCYKSVIKDYFEKKTSLKGNEDPDIVYQYEKSKNKLNGIYGMSAQDPVHQQIDFVNGDYIRHDYDSEDAQDSLKKANFPYQWGVYTTAWARYALQDAIDIAGDRVVYCDTDSVKTLGKVDFTELNDRLRESAQKAGACAQMPSGQMSFMGLFEEDAHYSQFITQGAKRYAFVKKGKLGLTVAGVRRTVNEETGERFAVEELRAAGGLEAFKPGRFIKDGSGEKIFVDGMEWIAAGKSESVYNDNDNLDILIDGHDLHISRNVSIIDGTYKMTHSRDYADLLKKINLYGKWKKETA